jgi:hypothetical protein|tara:strand:- start:294 stop:608 length:315 start_codon:yes stop_codon:yes gene_type:complete
MKLIADNGLPLKIQAQWTDNDYYERVDPELDDMKCINVAGWLIRINGTKYPRGHTDGDNNPDWTYRYTPEEGNTEFGKRIAIQRALTEAGLRVVENQTASIEGQ